MSKLIRMAVTSAFLTALFAMAVGAQTTGTVNLTGTVSKYVEITSGGAVTLTGNSGGGVTTDGTLGNPLAVVVNLGELGPSNTNAFVKATVPVRLRSNAAYSLSLLASVTGGTTAERVTAADVGFGLASVSRSGVGSATGTDTNSTLGDPTLLANTTNATTGRFEYATGNSNLGAYTTAAAILSGPYIMRAVPKANTTGALNASAIFSVKPQFYEVSSMAATATFTVTAP